MENRYHVNVRFCDNRKDEMYLVEVEDLERMKKRGCRLVIHDTKKDRLIHYKNQCSCDEKQEGR